MKKNMGAIDRIVRIVVALAIIILYFAGYISGTLAILLLVVGGIFIATSVVSTCPLYLPFSISTIDKKSTKE